MEFEEKHAPVYKKLISEYLYDSRALAPSIPFMRCVMVTNPDGTTALQVLDKEGQTRVSEVIWGPEWGEEVTDSQELPIYNEQQAEEALTMEFNNPNILSQRLIRDKAIIAMHVLRFTKPKNSKGIGPNREDHPIFREVVHMWLNGEEMDPDKLAKVEIARERVTKYSKQITNSRYHEVVTDLNVSRSYTLDFVRDAYKQQADAELEQVIKGETYGGW